MSKDTAMSDAEGKESPGGHNSSNSNSESDLDESFESLEERLLYIARHGKHVHLLRLLMSNEEADEGSKLNLNCKGSQKFNRGWTPLHLAAYFGQTAAARMLLDEVVGLLLKHGAETDVINSHNQKPKDVAENAHIIEMINAADDAASLRMDTDYFEAAVSGDTKLLSLLLEDPKGPNINARDSRGNSALHLAATGCHAEAVAMLLQHGIDTNLRNMTGHLALDLAQTVKMKQVLGVEPIKSLQIQPQRFEGYLLKKSRIVGFRLMWIVLDRGVLSYFNNRGDASTGSRRKGMKYLDEAKIHHGNEKPLEIRIQYSDGSKHTLHLESVNTFKLNLQKWLNALQEHVAFSTYYIHQGEGLVDETADDIVSLGTMQNSLQNAQAHKGSLEKQVQALRSSVDTISKHIGQGAGAGNSKGPAQTISPRDLQVVKSQAADILQSSQDMYTTLTHCMNLLSQQEELRQIQLREEQERCRVLQDSLHALATEHHELERSITRHQSFVSMDDEFFDCDDEEVYGSPGVEQFSDAVSRDLVLDEALGPRNGVTKPYGRTRLPVPMFARSDFSFWSILKQCIGKELSKITMPVVFNEPLSFIQRLAEYMEYAPLVEKASRCENPVERLEYVSAFAISALSSNWERIGKPFNPLLGETFELDRPDLGFRFVGEQVSHHPPITAFNAEGASYSFHGSVQPKLRFWGKSVEITPKGIISLELYKYKEIYTWQNVNCSIHNVIVGQLWVEHAGTMEITSNRNNYKAVINFKQSGWFGKDMHRIEGFIYNGKKKERVIYGSWVLGVYSCSVGAYEDFMANPDNKGRLAAKDKAEQLKSSLLSYNYDIPGQTTLWRVNPRPPHSSDYYHFSLFAMCLNEMLPSVKSSIAPTDSRLRPDIRSMEEGKIDGSAEEKNRLEEKQRDARKDRKKKSKEWAPAWFTQKKSESGKDEWVFDKTYWQRSWRDCPDIF